MQLQSTPWLRASAVAALLWLSANQAQAEQRYYGTSGPNSAPWQGLNAPTGTDQTCLCGYVYNGATIAWDVFEKVPHGTSCETKCPAPTDTVNFKPPPTFKAAQAKKCAAYTRAGGANAWTGPVTTKDPVCEWYFPSTAAISEWAGGYSPSGARKTKAIHFFNWGTGADPVAITKDPNALAAALHGKGWTINYWYEQVPGTKIVPGTHLTGITAKPIGAAQTVTSAGHLLAGTPLEARQAELDDLVKALVARGQYALVKDLLVLAILYKEGGYMIDNTFDMVDPEMKTPRDMDAVLTAGMRGGLQCPIYSTSPGSGVGNQPWESLEIPHLPTGVKSIFYELNVMYHPIHNEATIQALTCMMDGWRHHALTPVLTTPMSEHDKEDLKTDGGTMHTSCSATALVTCAHAHHEIPPLTAWLGIKGTLEQVATWRGTRGQPVPKGVPGATGRGRSKSFNGCLELDIWKEYSK